MANSSSSNISILSRDATDFLSVDEVCTRIRSALKRRSGKTWSVTRGRGTAHGWLTIMCPPKRRGCARFHEWHGHRPDDICSTCGASRRTYGAPALDSCPAHACTEHCYTNYLTPEDRRELAGLLALDYVHFQGESIPAGTDYYREYLARAEGRPCPVYGKPYWD